MNQSFERLYLKKLVCKFLVFFPQNCDQHEKWNLLLQTTFHHPLHCHKWQKRKQLFKHILITLMIMLDDISWLFDLLIVFWFWLRRMSCLHIINQTKFIHSETICLFGKWKIHNEWTINQINHNNVLDIFVGKTILGFRFVLNVQKHSKRTEIQESFSRQNVKISIGKLQNIPGEL